MKHFAMPFRMTPHSFFSQSQDRVAEASKSEQVENHTFWQTVPAQLASLRGGNVANTCNLRSGCGAVELESDSKMFSTRSIKYDKGRGQPGRGSQAESSRVESNPKHLLFVPLPPPCYFLVSFLKVSSITLNLTSDRLIDGWFR